MRASLRTRIMGWSFFPTAAILLVVALVTWCAYQRLTESLVLGRDRDLTALSARLLANELEAYTDPLADQFLAVFDVLIVFDARGNPIAAEPEQYEKWQMSGIRDALSSSPRSSTRPSFSNIVADGRNGEKTIVVILPAGDRTGGTSGGVAGLFRLDPSDDNALFQEIERLRRGDGSSVYLVDGKGRAIYHSQVDRIGQDLSGEAAVAQVLLGQAGALRTHDLAGLPILVSYAPVPGTSWGLVTEESWTALTAASRRYGRFSLLLLALGVLAPAAVVAVGVRRITRPIQELSSAAREMARGDLAQRISTPAGDELAELAEQFNLMAARLQESYAHLEGEVSDRTKQLGSLNAIAAEVNQSLDLKEILAKSLDQVLEVMALDVGQAFRLEENTEALSLMAQRGLPGDLALHTGGMPLDPDAAGEAMRQARPIVTAVSPFARPVKPPGTEPALQHRSSLPTLLREQILFLVTVPLMAKGKPVGVIELGARLERQMAAEELSLLTAIGLQIGIAVENARLHLQARQLAVIQERNRLAQDLHDSVTQALYGVNLCAEAATRHLSSGHLDTAAIHLREIRSTAEEALREMRLLISELRPPTLDREGLAGAIRARLATVEERIGLIAELVVRGQGRLSPEVEAGLYRVAQEALNNVLRHAHASRVTVCLDQSNGKVSLEIVDNGRGFNPQAEPSGGGFGLRGIGERVASLGGTLSVWSMPGEGTSIRVEV